MSSKIIYDAQILGLMNLFGKITHARLKDCISEEERLIFVVEEGELRKAIGKEAMNVKRLVNESKKKIKIVEYSNDMLKLIQNFIHPFKVDNIYEQEGIVVLESADAKTKGILIGRAAKNLRQLEEYIKRYFPNLKEIKVM